MKDKKTDKQPMSKKRHAVRVTGGKTDSAAATQETGTAEEVTAGFKAGKDLQA